MNEFVSAILWVGGTVGASLIWRSMRKDPFAKAESKLIFQEGFVSGRANTNWITVAGAGYGLDVTISLAEICIRPLPMGRLMFLPEVFDLEHYIGREQLISCTEIGEFLGARKFRLLYTATSGKRKSFEINLKSHDRFRQAMGAIRPDLKVETAWE